MITTDVLRDRITDVIQQMERQFAGISPMLEDLIGETLRGDETAYAELQSVGRRFISPMIDVYGSATATLAADWYDLNRELLKIDGDWSEAVVQEPNTDTGPLIGGAVRHFKSVETIISGISAGMGTRVHQAAQGTVMDSVLRDRTAVGWGRVAAAGCCEFCAMLAGRGNVYRTTQTATFAPHTDCRCMASPLWRDGTTGKVIGIRSREDTIATRRVFSNDPVKDAQIRARYNKQAREWIAQNRAQLGLLT